MADAFVKSGKFALLAGVSRVTICKMAREGKLVKRPDGKFSVKNPVNSEYINRDKSVNKKKGLGSRKKSAQKKQIAPKMEDVQEEDIVLETFNILKINEAGYLDKFSAAHVEKLVKIARMKKIDIETQEKRNKLISRELITDIFNQLYTIDTNEWRTLGLNVAPQVAADMGIDDPKKVIKIAENIDKETFATLKRVKKLVNKFLKTIKSEELKK